MPLLPLHKWLLRSVAAFPHCHKRVQSNVGSEYIKLCPFNILFFIAKGDRRPASSRSTFLLGIIGNIAVLHIVSQEKAERRCRMKKSKAKISAFLIFLVIFIVALYLVQDHWGNEIPEVAAEEEQSGAEWSWSQTLTAAEMAAINEGLPEDEQVNEWGWRKIDRIAVIADALADLEANAGKNEEELEQMARAYVEEYISYKTENIPDISSDEIQSIYADYEDNYNAMSSEERAAIEAVLDENNKQVDARAQGLMAIDEKYGLYDLPIMYDWLSFSREQLISDIEVNIDLINETIVQENVDTILELEASGNPDSLSQEEIDTIINGRHILTEKQVADYRQMQEEIKNTYLAEAEQAEAGDFYRISRDFHLWYDTEYARINDEED